MKNFVRSTYHFSADGPGDAPDEGGARRTILDTINLLGIGDREIPGPELRAVKAMTEGFTVEQFRLFCDVVDRAIKERRDRHANYSGDAPRLSKMVLEQTAQVEKIWRETIPEIRSLIAHAEKIHVSGLEPNSAERTAIATAEAHAS